MGCHFLLQGIYPTQGSNRASADALTSEPPGEPKECDTLSQIKSQGGRGRAHELRAPCQVSAGF